MTMGGSRGAVAAGHKLTAEAAVRILRDGGNAADAAIAALAMACVCEPVLASPGGGGFAMVHEATGNRTKLIDFFPHTPLAKRDHGEDGVAEIHADFGAATQAFHIGPATAATPGFVAGLHTLHEFGAGASLADLLAPAIKAGRNGVTVTPYQYYLSTVVRPILVASTEAAALFAPDGDLIEAGGTFRNPGLADAFDAIAGDDKDHGRLTAAIISAQARDGHLTETDLARYRAVLREPLRIEINDVEVLLNPWPAAGGTLTAHSLQALANADAAALAEALANTDQERRKTGSDVARLLNRPVRQKGTTHISVLDGLGNACAVTVSNGEGNGQLVGSFGFMLNNILGEEDVNPAGTDAWPTDTRLASMMCPAILKHRDGGLSALGSGGSNRIRSAMLQVIARLVFDSVDPIAAVDAPRLHIENHHLDFEDRFDPAVRQALVAAYADHRAWPEPNMFFGGVHMVARTADGTVRGAGDRRRDGVTVLVDNTV